MSIDVHNNNNNNNNNHSSRHLFTINDVQRIKAKQKQNKLRVVEYHFKKAYAKMCYAYSKNENSTTYYVAEYIPHLPRYSASEIAQLVKRCLERKGYLVEDYHIHYLKISFAKRPTKGDYLSVLLNRVSEKIRESAEQEKDYVVYHIPKILQQHLVYSYDMNEARTKLKKLLVQNGFSVNTYRDSDAILIYWSKHEPMHIKELEHLYSYSSDDDDNDNNDDDTEDDNNSLINDNNDNNDNNDKNGYIKDVEGNSSYGESISLKRLSQFLLPKVIQNVSEEKFKEIEEKYNKRVQERKLEINDDDISLRSR